MQNQAVLLGDEGMRHFVAYGYVTLKPDLPDGFHEQVYARLAEVFEKEGNPGNNLLPRIPLLGRVFNHPLVRGALTGIVGRGYHLHPHRHCHANAPGSSGQKIHKDSWTRRRHRTRWAMGFYYPQDTPVALGPTAIVPGSHLYNTAATGVAHNGEIALAGGAGTVTLVHYDLWHRGTENRGDRVRYMAKFLFTRLEEPSRPDWDHRSPAWRPPEGEKDRPMWRHLWNWHRGEAGRGGPRTDGASIDSLAGALRDPSSERTALDAAYLLGEMGAVAVPALMAALRDDSEFAQRNAGYGLTVVGKAAVPGLLKALRDRAPTVRALATDTLGDIGAPAQDAVSTLCEIVGDESVEVRRKVAEALGLAGQNTPAGTPALVQALRDEDEWVRRNASLSLARLGGNARDAFRALADALEDESRYVRANATTALRRIGTPEATETLLDFLHASRWCPSTTRESAF